MPFNLLFTEPLGFLVWIAAIVIALTVHEFSHALAGTALGDPTAKNSGRLTLNPLAHIDPLGFFALLFAGFGWGKPVPFNPYNLSVRRWGPAIVGMAGPAANLLFVGLSALVLKALRASALLPESNLLIQFLFLLLVVNSVLLLFNLIPVPPLDGAKLLFAFLSSPKYARARANLESRGPLILLAVILADSFLGLGILRPIFSNFVNLVLRLVQ